MNQYITEYGPIIRIPNNQVIIDFLDEILKKSEKEIEEETIKHFGISEKFLRHCEAGYKSKIIQRLFRDGYVYTWQLSNEIRQQNKGFVRVEKFESAAKTIDAYCQGYLPTNKKEDKNE